MTDLDLGASGSVPAGRPSGAPPASALVLTPPAPVQVVAPEQAAGVATLADGVVVGSAIVKLFQQHSGTQLRHELKVFVSALKRAISSPAI